MLDVVSMLAPQLNHHWGADDPTVLTAAVSFVFDRVLGVEAGGDGAGAEQDA